MSAVQSWLSEVVQKLRPTRSGAGVACSSRRVVRFLSAALATLQTSCSHQPSNPLPRATHSQSSKLRMDAWVTIALAASVMDLPNLLGEDRILPGRLGERSILPIVVAAP